MKFLRECAPRNLGIKSKLLSDNGAFSTDASAINDFILNLSDNSFSKFAV